MTLTANFAAIPDSRHAEEIERLCGAMEAADKAGCYPRLKVERPWSAVTPCLRSGDYLVKIVEEKNYSDNIHVSQAGVPGKGSPRIGRSDRVGASAAASTNEEIIGDLALFVYMKRSRSNCGGGASARA
jgi:hypothetical protein